MATLVTGRIDVVCGRCLLEQRVDVLIQVRPVLRLHDDLIRCQRCHTLLTLTLGLTTAPAEDQERTDA